MVQRFHPRSFSRPDILRKIDPANLIELLSPYKEYLAARGFQFSSVPAAPPDCERLAIILLKADKDAPINLIEGLHVIGNMGTGELIDDLLDLAIAEGVDLGSDEITPVDLAVRIWLKAPWALEKMERQSIFHKWLTFEHFPARVPSSAVTIDKLPTDLRPIER